MTTRIDKLQTLIEIENSIETFRDKIELKQDSINGYSGQFRELRDKYTDDIYTYQMCIMRLQERFNKVLKTVK
tara:strand:+ start:278 stop:496 length:219 start_codon:yes stop_codon:yes gene_type:complete